MVSSRIDGHGVYRASAAKLIVPDIVPSSPFIRRFVLVVSAPAAAPESDLFPNRRTESHVRAKKGVGSERRSYAILRGTTRSSIP